MTDTTQQLLELENYLTHAVRNWQTAEMIDPMGDLSREQHQLIALLQTVKYAQAAVVKIIDADSEISNH